MGATVFVQPLDLVKNRMQMSGEQFHNLNLNMLSYFECFLDKELFLQLWAKILTLLEHNLSCIMCTCTCLSRAGSR